MPTPLEEGLWVLGAEGWCLVCALPLGGRAVGEPGQPAGHTKQARSRVAPCALPQVRPSTYCHLYLSWKFRRSKWNV